MTILSTKGWDDYQLIDSGEELRLERWDKYYLVRPDPQAIWKKKREQMPHDWRIRYGNLTVKAHLTPYKDKRIIEAGELALEEDGGRLLATGIFARWKNG